MEKPYKFWVFDKELKKDVDGAEYNSEQLIPAYYAYNKRYQVYVDTRYEAKKRLFEYLHPEQKPKPYRPFEGTEIGKSLPILNF